MPNGHGVPLGCMVCGHFERGEPNPLMGHCQKHAIDIDMDIVCADFDNEEFISGYIRELALGTLYQYTDVDGYGYPPPTELVPLGNITDYRGWDKKQKQQAYARARQIAKTLYEQRRSG